MELFGEALNASSHPYVRRLGEGAGAPEDGIVGRLDLLARAGLPVPEGMVITQEAHRAFLESSGLLREILAHAGGEKDGGYLFKVPRSHMPSLVEGELNRAICEALMELGAPSVVVISEEVRKGSLRSIPEVKEALLEAWLSERGLERQVRAAARAEEEIPTWPVLIQRKLYSRYTGWSTTGEEEFRPQTETEKKTGKERTVALYNFKPAERSVPGSKSIARLTLEAESVLGEGASILWGLEGGRWCLLSAVRRENNKPVERQLP